MNSLDNLINFFIVNNSRTCTLSRVQTAIVSNYKIQYISLLNVKFVLQKIVATSAGGIYLQNSLFITFKCEICTAKNSSNCWWNIFIHECIFPIEKLYLR